MNASDVIDDMNALSAKNVPLIEAFKGYTRKFTSSDKKELALYREISGDSWSATPILHSSRWTVEFQTLAAHLPRILFKATTQHFKRNPGDLNKFLFLDQSILRLAEGYSKEILESMFLRCDVVLGREGLKIVEVNVGTQCGGADTSFLLDIAQAPILQMNWKSNYTDPSKLFFQHFSSCVSRVGNFIGKPGVVVVLLDSQPSEELSNHYKGAFAAALPLGAESELIVETDPLTLVLREDGTFGYQEKTVLGVILGKKEMPENLLLNLTRAFLGMKLTFPDSPLHMIFGNKMLLPLIKAAQIDSSFSETEREFIGKYIPETWACINEIPGDGNKYSIDSERVSEQRTSWVLKKGNSMQGRDVFIGKYTSQEQWDRVVEKGFKEGDWIAQEVIDPFVIRHPNSDSEVTNHKLVLGAFIYCQKYGGTFVRVAEETKNIEGVINSARGAREAIWLECE